MSSETIPALGSEAKIAQASLLSLLAGPLAATVSANTINPL